METTFHYLRQFGPLLAERILETSPPMQSTKDPVAPRIEGPRPDLMKVVGMIGIEQERVEQDAHQALVAAMRFHRGADIQGEDAVELLFCDLPQGRTTAMTGAGKYYIDIAPLLLDRVVEPVEISQLGRIGLHSGHIPPYRLDRVIQVHVAFPDGFHLDSGSGHHLILFAQEQHQGAIEGAATTAL